jgi:hypothetical protein
LILYKIEAYQVQEISFMEFLAEKNVREEKEGIKRKNKRNKNHQRCVYPPILGDYEH